MGATPTFYFFPICSLFPSQSTVWVELGTNGVRWREEWKALPLLWLLLLDCWLLTWAQPHWNIRRPDQFYDVFLWCARQSNVTRMLMSRRGSKCESLWQLRKLMSTQAPAFAVFFAGKLRLLLGLSADVCKPFSLAPISLYKTCSSGLRTRSH